ncbi:hypothetical protein [Amycolatopsis alba]|uniref:Uncharacterized protein n=1 Tax=Amycolatopsis alba DSM 44262 TaxID=1125972 RepID=A0A229S7J8_AMYAL|nr:hypothetical protein [Amycolatopsis alba]OXM54721.1 hypothetical protein CFP75_02745 [Amycolatopsis alba DSM 44262]
MNPLVKPPRVLGTGTLAFAGLLTATVLASGLSNSLESTLDTGVRQVSYEPPSESAKGKLKAQILAKMIDLAGPLDPADPAYRKKLYQQVLANRAITKLGSGSVSFSVGDLQGMVSDVFEIHRRSKQDVTGLRNRMSKVDDRIAALRQQEADAKTQKARDRISVKITQETNGKKGLGKLLKKAEHDAKQFNPDARIRNLERTIWGLEQQTNGKQSAATKKKLADRLEQAHEELKTLIKDRDGGTLATPKSPKQTANVRVPPPGYALEKTFRGASQLRAGVGFLQGIAPPYSFKEVHDNKYLPTAYSLAQALQDAPTEKDKQSIKNTILRYVLPDAHKRKTFLEALRNTYRPQIVPDGKGNYVKAVNPIRTEWEEHIARAFPVKVPTTRELAVMKQEQLDRQDKQRGAPLKKALTPKQLAVLKQEQLDRQDLQRGIGKPATYKPVYSRKDAIAKQEQLDRQDLERGIGKPATKKTAKPHAETSREAAIRKQEQLDRQDLQRGTGKKAETKKTETKKPTGKGGRNIASPL